MKKALLDNKIIPSNISLSTLKSSTKWRSCFVLYSYYEIILFCTFSSFNNMLKCSPLTILAKGLIGTARSSLFLSVYCTSAWLASIIVSVLLAYDLCDNLSVLVLYLVLIRNDFYHCFIAQPKIKSNGYVKRGNKNTYFKYLLLFLCSFFSMYAAAFSFSYSSLLQLIVILTASILLKLVCDMYNMDVSILY